MRNVKLFLAVFVSMLIVSCGNNNKPIEQKTLIIEPPRDQYLQQIKKLEDELRNSDTVNNITATQAIKAYLDYVLFFPNDSIAPGYLFKAGELAASTHHYTQALTYYQKVTASYPNFKYFKESLYLQGFLLDNFLNSDDKAKIIYEEIIDKYPATNYANDAKAAINNLGKTDEQLIKEFKKKNKQK